MEGQLGLSELSVILHREYSLSFPGRYEPASRRWRWWWNIRPSYYNVQDQWYLQWNCLWSWSKLRSDGDDIWNEIYVVCR